MFRPISMNSPFAAAARRCVNPGRERRDARASGAGAHAAFFFFFSAGLAGGRTRVAFTALERVSVISNR